MEKNPSASNIPTIDEFGGYCKFSKPSEVPLDKVIEIDWNEKIRLLVLDCEREELLKEQTEPKEKVHKRRKTEDSQELEVNHEAPEPLVLSDDDSFCTPPKKTKRQRYCSDATNATRSGLKKFEGPQDLSINPFLQDDVKSDYDFEDYHFASPLHFASEPFKLGAMKVSNTRYDLLICYV